MWWNDSSIYTVVFVSILLSDNHTTLLCGDLYVQVRRRVCTKAQIGKISQLILKVIQIIQLGFL